MKISLTLNGKSTQFEAPPQRRFLDVLREDLGLTGSKEGCGEGECGACTVLVDGAPVNSCLLPACHADGRDIRTIEGIAKGDELNIVQHKLIELGGTQCGICTPGIALSAVAALEREPGADRRRIRELLAGNLCRCTGYQLVVDAVAAALDGAPRS